MESDGSAVEIEKLHDERLFRLADPGTFAVSVVLFNHVQEKLLRVLLAILKLILLCILHRMKRPDLLRQLLLQIEYSILNTFYQLLALYVEIEGHLWWREKILPVAASLEPQVDHGFDHALIYHSESLV